MPLAVQDTEMAVVELLALVLKLKAEIAALRARVGVVEDAHIDIEIRLDALEGGDKEEVAG